MGLYSTVSFLPVPPHKSQKLYSCKMDFQLRDMMSGIRGDGETVPFINNSLTYRRLATIRAVFFG